MITYHGAWIEMAWNEAPDSTRSAYVSFEQPTDEQYEDDDFDISEYVTPSGKHDDDIFYYFDSREDMLQQMAGDEFKIVAIEGYHTTGDNNE